MDLRTFKEKLDQLGSQNNHLEVFMADEMGDIQSVVEVGVFEKKKLDSEDLELAVIVGHVPGKPGTEKVNAAGITESEQRHEIPEDQIGRHVALEPVIINDGLGPKELPQVDSTSNKMINSAGVSVENQRSEDPLAGLQEIK